MLLLGFTLVSFSTRHACAQAGGGGGGDRAVLIGATSDAPGITVTGPIEDGFQDGVSAFIVEFTPTKLDDEPPAHASVLITIAPEDGWTLQQPDPGNMPIERNTPRGDFADEIEWQATRIVQGAPEDIASGTVRVVWPWAGFEVGQLTIDHLDTVADFAQGDEFYKEVGMQMDTVVTIQVIPTDLPEQFRDEEASRWMVGWSQNMTSLGRTCYYPHKTQVIWWDTTIKTNMPIFDSEAKKDEEAVPLWYSGSRRFFLDAQPRITILTDYPKTFWKWHLSPMDDQNWSASRAYRALQVDKFRAWLVAARGEDDAIVVNWLKHVNWGTNLKVDLVVIEPNNPHPWSGMGFSIEDEAASFHAGHLNEGKGDSEPDIEPPNYNQLNHRVTNEK